MGRYSRWMFLLLAAVLLAGCGGANCKRADVEKAMTELQAIHARWTDAFNLADSTPRMSLPPVISDLQAIKRDAAAITVPPCMEVVQDDLVGSMDYAIEGYLDFVGQESDALVDTQFKNAARKLEDYTDGLTRISECAPRCE